MSEEEIEAKECLYKAYKKASRYMAEHEKCMSACYTGFENKQIKIEVRIKRKEQ
jgi:hypothetical protein